MKPQRLIFCPFESQIYNKTSRSLISEKYGLLAQLPGTPAGAAVLTPLITFYEDAAHLDLTNYEASGADI